MKSNRTFVRKSGKLEIKTIVQPEDDGRSVHVALDTDRDRIFRMDKLSFIMRQTCAFVRSYIPGEFDGFALPENLDLNEITHTFVIIAGANGIDKREGEEHVYKHLEPLGDTYKAVIFDMEDDRPVNARIPLLPEQVEVIQQDIKKGKK